jgi:hypothetical protein
MSLLHLEGRESLPGKKIGSLYEIAEKFGYS